MSEGPEDLEAKEGARGGWAEEVIRSVPWKKVWPVVLSLVTAVTAVINSQCAKEQVDEVQETMDSVVVVTDSLQEQVDEALSTAEFDAYRDSLGRVVRRIERRVGGLESAGRIRKMTSGRSQRTKAVTKSNRRWWWPFG